MWLKVSFALSTGDDEGLTERCRNANDDTLASQLLCKVDLVLWSSFDQLDVGDGVTCLNHDCG